MELDGPKRARRVSWLATALALVAALTTALASAPALAEPSASDKETARALMKDGDAKRAKGDLEGALRSFQAAHAIMGVPTTGLELGRAQADLGLLVEARDTLLGVTRLPVSKNENAAFTAAREAAQTLADELEPRIPSITVLLANVPKGQTPKVSIDGQPIPAATIGVPRKHNPGKLEIVVSLGAGEAGEKKLTEDLAVRESKEVTVDLAGVGGTPPPAPEREEPKPAPPPVKSATSPLVWVGFGGAAVFGLAGAVTGALAFSKASAAKDGCDGSRCPPATHDDIDSSKTFGTISTITFGLAGASAIVGVVGLLTGTSEEKPPATARATEGVKWNLGIGPNGAVVFGRF